MTTFVALYRGATVGEAQLVAVSADPDLVAHMAGRLLRNEETADAADPVLDSLLSGRRAALRVIAEDEG